MTPVFTFGTLCSGIEAASEAFIPLGAECLYVSEIEPYPCGVLADRHGAGKPMRMPQPADGDDLKTRRAKLAAIRAVDRFPRWANRLPNFGDLTQIDPEELPAVDLLVAGFPCQDFSIAGLRQSLAGARGNLTLYGVALIHELVRLRKLRSVLLEQVPDILNTKDNAFGALLGGLVGHDAPIASPLKGGRWTDAGVAVGPLGTAAWRVEDAQYSQVAQRRERMFAVASFGDGPDPVEVLLERQGMSRNPPARRQAREGTAGYADAGAQIGGEPSRWQEDGRPGSEERVPFGCDYGQDVGRPLVAAAAGNRSDLETETIVVGTLTGSGGKAAGSATNQDAEAGLLTSHRDDSDTYIAQTLVGGGRAAGGYSHDDLPLVAHSLRADGFDASEGGTGRGTPLVPVAYSIMPQNSGKDYKARVVDVAQPLMASSPVGGDQGGDYIVQPVAFSCKDHGADASEIAPTMRAMGHGATHPNAGGQIAVAIPINPNALCGEGEAKTPSRDAAGYTRLRDPGLGVGANGDPADTLQASGPGAVAFSLRGREGGAMPEVEDDDLVPSLRAAEGGSTRPFVAGPEMAVRRITVVEACRLQGFPDFYTLIEWPTANRKGAELEEQVAYLIGHGFDPDRASVLAQTPDGPQYKALGNSKAVPHVRKIGVAFGAALSSYLDRGAA